MQVQGGGNRNASSKQLECKFRGKIGIGEKSECLFKKIGMQVQGEIGMLVQKNGMQVQGGIGMPVQKKWNASSGGNRNASSKKSECKFREKHRNASSIKNWNASSGENIGMLVQKNWNASSGENPEMSIYCYCVTNCWIQ